MILRQWKKHSEFGIVINWKFHLQNKWVSIFGPYLVKAIIEEFDPIIISSQTDYKWHKKKLKYIIAMEPRWAAPEIKYDKKIDQIVCMLSSDPHNKTEWLENYVQTNNIDYVLSQYFHPFFYHFPNFPSEKFIHFPWAVPDEFVLQSAITIQNNKVIVFGGKKGESYDLRNWCRAQKGITNYPYSGVENKIMSDIDYIRWLARFDAIIAAGSSNPKYDLVTPKYFEIASTGALLIGQYCKDLACLGFDDTNMLVFTKDNFINLVQKYKSNPESYLSIRKNGRELISGNHLISHRVKTLRYILKNKSVI